MTTIGHIISLLPLGAAIVGSSIVSTSGAAVDLRTGRARGPLTSRAEPIVPDFLSLP